MSARVSLAGYQVFRLALNVFVFVIALLFLVRQFFTHWGEFGALIVHIDWAVVGFSFIVYVVSHLFLVFLWRDILSHLSSPVAYWKAVFIFSVSSLGKYIPGKIWSFVGMVHLARQEGIPASKTLSTVFLSFVFIALSGLFLFLLSLSWWGFLGVRVLPSLGIMCALAIVLLASSNRVFFMVPRIVAQWLGKDLDLQGMSARSHASYLGMYTLFWAVFGAGFHLMVSSFYPLPLSYLPLMISVSPIAILLGYVVFILPGGIGVREGVYTFLLGTFLPPSVALAAAIAARLWMSFGEMLMVVFSSLILRARPE